MKKRILSILLAMCMLMSLLPVAAFAAAYEAPTNVTPAILHDTRDANAGGIADEDLVAADSYKVTCEEPASADTGVNHVIKLVATDLKRHRNGDSPENMGYWAGVAIAAPEGATHMKAVAKLSTESLGTAFESAQVREVTPNITADNKGGFVQYLDVSAEAYKAGVFYVKLQWYKNASDAVDGSSAIVYKVDFSGVKLANPMIGDLVYKHDGADANAAAAALKKALGLGDTAPTDSDQDTLCIPIDNLDPRKTYVTKMKAPGVTGDGYVTCNGDTAGTIDRRKSANGAEVLRVTLNPVAENPESGAYLYTGTDTTKQIYRIQPGTYTVEVYESTVDQNDTVTIGDKVADKSITLIDVKFMKNDGTTTEPIKTEFVADGGKATAPMNPTREDYAFKGWATSADSTTVVNVAETAITTTTNTFYAVWEKEPAIVITDAVLYDSSGDIEIIGVTAEVGKAATEGGAATINLKGTISDPGANTTYKLKYTTNAASDNSGEATVTYTKEGTTWTMAPATIELTGAKYTLTSAIAFRLAGTNVGEVTASQPTTKLGDDKKTDLNGNILADEGLKITNGTLVNTEVSNALDEKLTETLGTGAAAETKKTELISAANTAANDSKVRDTIESVVYLDVAVTDYNDTDKSLTLEVTPMWKLQAVKAGDATVPAQNILNTTTQEVIGGPLGDDVKVGAVTITVKLPDSLGAEANLYAHHTHGDGVAANKYVYAVTKAGSDGSYTGEFTNPNGFSEIEINATAPDFVVAGDAIAGYDSFADAVAAITGGTGTITVNKTLAATDAVTVDRVVTITLAAGPGVTLIENLLVAGSSVQRHADETGNTYTFETKTVTPTPPSSSGGGGSSSSVSVPSASNGKVTVSNNNAKKGDTVTITLTPNTGYVVDTVTVTDSKGNTITVTKTDDTHYTFVMPEGRVTVKATFKQADAPTDGFTDVAADAYYADAVKWAVDKGITNGLTATTFGPNNSCTRGQMVTFLWRAAGSPAATGTNSFTDVASGEYYYNAVLWAVEKGITKGTTATTFSPNATVNRGQTVTFLYRYAESPAVTGDSAFTDVAADAYYADAVKWAVAEEITNGTSATTFAPASNCTRGQIVTFLYRQMAE